MTKHHNEAAPFRSQHPEKINAYLVGGGIASLASAVHLLHDAKVPASQIHILESSSVPGGSMDGAGTAESGYVLRGGRMLNFSYLCTYELLATIPSLSDPKKTVMQEIEEFNAIPENKTNAHARLVAKGAEGPEIVDVKQLGLSMKDRLDLVHMSLQTEGSLGTKKITDCFGEAFFETKFWYMWATMFAFQPWHSAVEFRRYLHRFIHEFKRINTLAGVDRTPLNQHDSIILPIETYLKAQGVDFRYNTRVTRFSFQESPQITVNEIHTDSKGTTGVIHVQDFDIVFATIGSMTACSSIGSNTKAPAPIPSTQDALKAPDGTWALWDSLTHSQHGAAFGNPSSFYTRPTESNWLSFTVTLHDPSFFSRLVEWSGNTPGTGALITFKDSTWLMSIVVPKQPHFLNQPEDVQVFWGYALFPDKIGDFVKKPMEACSGQEILNELLGHLNFPQHPTLESATTIPCMMPYITSQFLTRAHKDRPKVIPEGSTNLALLGQYVEIDEDTVFTVEYSVRGAQMAVYEMMGVNKKPKAIYKGEHDVRVLAEALKMLIT
ncbi:Uncharacterized protein BP5553_08427 [Venustampulla echinocandica]|uniref:Oleate hydratase n=1 Tax=Venustampulla echinocandica TaxID=2656787 RepID=A0A370TE82_9HELO|nr:Uncharacterized protein BP5553_08427 [Venustampulla echinocandica]RDL32988.1 Uncharacterized protein BP5553_08427 [Venustampulla echinocandica]